MNLNGDVRALPWKKVLFTSLTLLVLGGAAFAGWSIYRKAADRPLTLLESKQAIAAHLEKQTGKSEFKSSIDISKEKSAWNALKFVYDAPPDYKTVYRSIGEHLSVAEGLLKSGDEKSRQNGLRLIAELLEVAEEIAYDPWLAARITDAYLVPQFDVGEETPKSGYSQEQLIHIAGRVYRNADEDDRLIDLYKIYLTKFPTSSRANDIRRRLAQALQSKGQRQEAQVYLAQIKSTPAATDTRTRRDGQSRDRKTATN